MKLLKIDTALAADGSSISVIHAENEADSTGAVTATGQISLPYAPSYQTLEILDAYTRKADGTKVPVDVSAIFDQLPQARPGMPMVTDVHVKTIVFPQFAAGDTAVYTARRSVTHPLFPGQYVGGNLFPRLAAYDDVEETLTAPAGVALRVENKDVDFRKTSAGGQTVYRWHYSAPSSGAIDLPSVNPFAQMPHYFVSTFADYAALGRAYAESAAPQSAVTPGIKSLADVIAKNAPDRRATVRAIYEWVSGHIRYVAIELGKGSVVPHAADVVLANGYGDCKDHVALMEALLKAEGIESEAALINATTIYALSDVPTYSGLDHVITFVPDLNLFLDSTNGLTPFGVLPFAEYGKPVVLASLSSPRLGATPVLGAGLATMTTKTVAHLGKDGTLSGATTTSATGPYAIELRALALAVQTVGSEIAAKAVMAGNGYGENASGALEAPPASALSEPFSITGTFTSDGWKEEAAGTQSFDLPGGMRVLGLSGDGLMGRFFDDSKATASIEIPCYSGEATEDLSLEAPAGTHFARVPEDTHVNSPNIRFDSHWTLENTTLSVHRHYASTIDRPLCTSAIRAANAEALKTIAASYNVALSLGSGEGARVTDWYAQDIANPPKDPKLATALTDARAAMQRHHDSDAIAQFSAILAGADLPISVSYPARYDRAVLYARNLRTDEALADLNAALALTPRDVRMQDTRAAVWFERADFAHALADCEATLADHPTDAFALHLRANIAMETGRYQDAVRDYTSELQVKGNSVALMLRAVAYHKLGREKDAGDDIALAVQYGAKTARQAYETITHPAANPVSPDDTRQTSATIDTAADGSGTDLTAANVHSATYPMLSALLGEAGRVKLGFTVDANGNVSSPRIAESSGFPTLDAASLTAVKSWRYKPARHDGIAVATEQSAQLIWAFH